MPRKKKDPEQELAKGRTLRELELEFMELKRKYDTLFEQHMKLHKEFIKFRDQGRRKEQMKAHLEGLALHEEAEGVLHKAKKVMKAAEKKRGPRRR